ncbi:PAS domain S-box protein [Peribacillus sp. B-H-3]|uniref:PAS domain S-box protein n=1 Tax=Peribacillus sp. B-H-3 TaxID=3400420 RepID=UPI003B01C3FE
MMETELAEIAAYKKEISKLKSQLEQCKLLSDKIFDPFIIVNQERDILYGNQSACVLLNTPKEKLQTMKITHFLKVVPSHILQLQEEKIEKDGIVEDEWLIQLLDGEIKHIEFTGYTYNSICHTIFKLKDITLERSLEREKMMSMQMFLDVFNQAIDSIVIYDRSGIIIDSNTPFCQSLKLDKSEVVGRNITDFISESSLGIWEACFKQVQAEGSSSGVMEIKSYAAELKVDFSSTANIFNGFYMCILNDITEKSLIEQKLMDSERIFSELFEQTMDAIVFWDQNGTIFRVNDSACRIFESNRESLIGCLITEYVAQKDERFYNMIDSFNRYGAVREELFYKMPNGQLKLLELTAKMHSSEGYNITIFRNVSERWRIEMELRKSEKKFRKIFEGSLDGMIIWNLKGFADINETGCNILGFNKEKFLSMNVNKLLESVPENAVLLNEHIDQVLKKGSFTSVIPVIFEEGSTKYIEFSTRKNLYSGLHLTIFRDITKSLEMQEQLKKSDTLNVVGELAAGIAHEIRNPMTALKGFIQLLQGSVKEDFSNYFNVITSELQRIETIITEFLVLAKPQAVKYFRQNINSIMKETLELLTAQALMLNIQFEVNYQEADLMIYCEGNQLKQVFINIIKNALEVMPDGGIVRVETSREGDRHIKITIADQGIGISEEKIRKLGEPFYTTKERGTGLGLMVSYKIVEEHRGWVEVESEEGKGTAFHLFLPMDRSQKEPR